MAVREILKLGNEKLYLKATEMTPDALPKIKRIVDDLHDTMVEFRRVHGFGRAIAAPQIDEPYRVIYMNIDDQITAFINPVLEPMSNDEFVIWDDCMSFPGLEVLVKRYKQVRVRYKDLDWQDQVLEFEGDLSELIQHEYDHLDGILAVQRAVSNTGFRMSEPK